MCECHLRVLVFQASQTIELLLYRSYLEFHYAFDLADGLDVLHAILLHDLNLLRRHGTQGLQINLRLGHNLLHQHLVLNVGLVHAVQLMGRKFANVRIRIISSYMSILKSLKS